MSGFMKDLFSRNLRKPQKGLASFIMKKFFENKNTFLETNAVKTCNIKPDDVVLEVGYGPGVGLEAAYQYVKGGKGKIYGLDLSEAMVKQAKKRLRSQIQEGKVHALLGDVSNLPFKPEMFDHVFHCNCYYFWDDQVQCAKQLHRVMKPGSRMITALNSELLKAVNAKGLMKYGNTDSDRYMESLGRAGFSDVKLENFVDTDGSGLPFQIIFATVPEKN